MVLDNFTSKGAEPSILAPARILEEITPDDSNDITYTTRALNVATSGSVKVTTEDGDTGTVYISAGIAFPIRVTRVWSTGTTATTIVGLS